jgi:flagellar assembly factor FliW
MKIKTTRFGEIDVPESELVSFPDGLVGLPMLKTFAFVANPKGGPFRWLQPADEPGLAWIVTDPALFFPDYKVKVRAEELEPIRLGEVSGGVVLVILTVPPGGQGITANLQGPIVVNVRERLARQFVIQEPGLSTRQPLAPGAK